MSSGRLSVLSVATHNSLNLNILCDNYRSIRCLFDPLCPVVYTKNAALRIAIGSVHLHSSSSLSPNSILFDLLWICVGLVVQQAIIQQIHDKSKKYIEFGFYRA